MSKSPVKAENWLDHRLKIQNEDKYSGLTKDFIDDENLIRLLDGGRNPDSHYINDILEKSLEIKTLSPQETAALLNVKDEDVLGKMRETALKVKKKVYDNRIVTFAPLYISNYCVNDCIYCGFRKRNKSAKRNLLNPSDLKNEIEALAGRIGHKRLIVVFGEHPLCDCAYMARTISQIYDVVVKKNNSYGNIRRVNVNAAPQTVNELELLKKAGIGTYQVFQETYHHKTFNKVHPVNTLKNNYKWRLYCMHRAMEAGIDDVGIGALFGLYDWKFEVMGLLLHAIELEKEFGIGPHTISFPRMEPAANSLFSQKSNYKVCDEDFKKLVTVIRLAVPYTGMILTARESPEMRNEVLGLGCTQTDASSNIMIGGYSGCRSIQDKKQQQFLLGDTRTLDELIRDLANMGYITSFCTAGYRCGRTGGKIMELLCTGKEGKFCKLNAILTYREWLDDFASDETKIAGEIIIKKELDEVMRTTPNAYSMLLKHYNRIENGERDLYF